MARYGSGTYQLTGGMTPTVKMLLILTVAIYVLQVLADRATGGAFSALFALSAPGIRHGMVWQFVTYLFLHSTRSPFHLLFNMLVLFFMGPETERAMGARQFRILYFLSGGLAGLGWLLIGSGQLVGASGAIFGVLAAFAALFPERRITLLLFLILPVTMQAWVLVAALVGIELLYLIGQSGGDIAHAAHLAGALAGYVYTTTVFRGGRLPWTRIRIRKGPRLRVVPPPVPRKPRDDAEIDRILEKIAREGVQSLSRSEKERLEEASRSMHGRR